MGGGWGDGLCRQVLNPTEPPGEEFGFYSKWIEQRKRIPLQAPPCPRTKALMPADQSCLFCRTSYPSIHPSNTNFNGNKILLNILFGDFLFSLNNLL